MHHDYEAIVTEALTQPGKLSERYSSFWNYSLGNQWYAMIQLGRAEPISTFPGWKSLGRHVKKGERAIELLMPVFKKTKDEVTGEKKNGALSFFMSRKNWFGLHQTDGEDYVPVIPGFDFNRAMQALNIHQEVFQQVDGNCQGYAIPAKRTISVSSIAFDKIKTGFHEAAHIICGHSAAPPHEDTALPKDVRECEAELTAYLCKASLGLTSNLEYSRGYIAHWRDDHTVEKIRYPIVFNAADQILKAGRPAQQAESTLDTATL
jgi:hypothetical protein